MSKITSQEDLSGISEKLKAQGKRVITTNGAFDILHVGHIRALQKTKSFGDVLFIGLNSDSSIKKYKDDKRPIISENDRAEMLAALECVDYVSIFTETDPREFLERVKPHLHVKSGDYDGEKMIETPVVRKNGGEIKIIPFTEGYSTTNLIKRIGEVYEKTN